MRPGLIDNEKELLRLVAKGDQNAYKVLFNHYWDQIYSTALVFTKAPELSQDMAQDVFVQIWIKRERLSEVDNFEAYLYTVARNLFFDKLRKKVFIPENEEYYKTYFEESLYNPGQQLEVKEFEETIYNAIGKLPQQQQTAFRLSRLKGLNHEDIADQMGISRQTVKSYIVRSIVTLRKLLQENSGKNFISISSMLFMRNFF